MSRKDHNKVRIGELYEKYLHACDVSYERCLQDYRDGKGVTSYYRHVGRIKAAHDRFEKKVKGEEL